MSTSSPSDEETEDGSEPGADGLDAAVRLARIRQRMFARLEPARIAQYHVMRRIGGGAMGLVFAAWDPSLDRAVAIKVLRDSDSGDGGRLRIEAQALARLGHPNVVTVFEVGDHDGQLYLAMEYVEGQTLHAWIAEWRAAARRDWPALREVFVQIAKGLAAAHSAGVVHRDVKPENIMIDAEQRVRVMDFGLARHRAPARDDAAAIDTGDSNDDVASTLTRVCGTPAYMAPEQLEGRPAAAAADQFALGATLFEAVYGRRIRSGPLAVLAASAMDPIALPVSRGVPRALRGMLTRLLATEPEQRFGSMDEVVTELVRQSRRGTNRWTGGTVAMVLGAGGLAAGWAMGAPEDQRCTGAGEQLAGVWDDATASEVGQALQAEPSGLGASTWAWIGPELDAYRDAWVADYQETCQATHVRRELPLPEMERRVACLYDRRRHLAVAVDLLRSAGPRTLARADGIVAALPSTTACADPDYAASERFPGVDDEPAQRRAEAIVAARARFMISETTEAHAEVQAALEDAREAGDGVAEARALLLLGRISANLLRFDEARAHLVAAYEGARRHELPVVAAGAALTLSKLTTRALGRIEEGRVWQSLIALEWPATGNVRRTMLRALARAMVERTAGDPDASLRAATEAAALASKLGPEHRLVVAQVRRALARLYLSMGRLEPGAALAEQALEDLEAFVGVGHPATASALQTVALARRHHGDMEGAVRASRAELVAVERGLGEDRKPLVPGLEALANGLAQTGAVEEALAALDKADRLLADGGSVLTRARLASRRGMILADRSPSEAADAQRRAYDWAREAIGDNKRETLLFRVSLAVALRRAGKEDVAAPLLQGALEQLEGALGDDEHADIADIHGILGSDALSRDDYDAAVKHFDRALEIWGDDAGSSYARAPLHIGACSAQTQAGRPEAALAHCEAAQALVERARGVADGTPERMHEAFALTLAALGKTAEAERHRRLAKP